MKTKLQVFANEDFGEIRTVTIDGEPWLVGRDVALALGYAKPENAISVHVDDEDKTTTLIQGTGSNYKSNAVLINESGVYSLIMGSKLPNAKKFKHWVTSEVLPALRKTGSYTMPKASSAVSREDYLKAAEILATCKEEQLPMVVDLIQISLVELTSF